MLNAINFKGNYSDIKNPTLNKQTRVTRQQGLQHDVVEFSCAKEIDQKPLLMDKAKHTVQKVEKLLDDLQNVVPAEYNKAIEIAQDVEDKFQQGKNKHEVAGSGEENLREFKDGKLVRESEFYDGILRNVKVYNNNDEGVCDMYVYFNAQKPAHVVKDFQQKYLSRQYDKFIGLAGCEVGLYEENVVVDANGIRKNVELIASHNHLSEYRENTLLNHGKFNAENIVCFDSNSQPSTYYESAIHENGEVVNIGKVDLSEVE